MKIISGFLGGREIRTVAGKGMRPAMGRTRESLFSMLEARGFVWENARVLDLFAGGGSLGLECVSRGAAEAVLGESSRPVVSGLTVSVAELGVGDKCRVVQENVIRFLRSYPPSPFNVIFIDPPYRENLARPVFKLLSGAWMAPGCFVVAELEPDADPEAPPCLEKLVARQFGQTTLSIWRKDEDSPLPGDI